MANDLNGETAAESVERLFFERMPKVFDKLIAAHDPQDGKKMTLTLFGRLAAAVALPSMDLFVAVYLPLDDDYEIMFGSGRPLAPFECMATYKPPDKTVIDPGHFEPWLLRQIDRALDIAKDRSPCD